MNPHGEHQKRISFTDKDKNHADLIIRLKHDGLTMAKFFRSLVKAYINQDYAIVDFIERVKSESKLQSKRQTQIIHQKQEAGKLLQTKFALDETEVENIFDILEKEHPDL